MATVRWGVFFFVVALVTTYGVLLVVTIPDIARLFEHIWIFGPIGVFGAVIASSTGTGGGVVYVPAFNALSEASAMGNVPMEISIAPVNIVAISFLIQCFGMSVGSSVWTYRLFGSRGVHPHDQIDANTFMAIIFAVCVTALPTLLVTQVALFSSVDGQQVITAFKWFSLFLGIVLLVFTWSYTHSSAHTHNLSYADIYWLMLLGAIGGAVTAFFSVGVGEFVAVYLMMRRFSTIVAVAAAVIISAIVVVAGVWFHVWNGNILWPIALTAVPGAMLGGSLARLFATWLGPLWLKTFASVWIIASSAFLIVGPWVGWLAR